MEQKILIKNITDDIYFRTGMVFENTRKNRNILSEKGYGDNHFNWEKKEGKYLEIVSSDCYLLVNSF